MRRVLKILLPLLILAGAIGVFAALKASRPRPPVAQITERIWRVEVEEVRLRTLAPSLTLYGRVETPTLFKAAAPAPARVTEVRVKEGQWVESDQILALLDQRDFLPRLEQARADVAELEAQLQSEDIRHRADLAAREQEERLLTLTTAGVTRAHTLLKQRLGSDADLEQAEQLAARQALALTSRRQAIQDHPMRRAALKARLRRAQAQLDEVALEEERSRVRAPYPGIVTEVQISAGDQVAKNALLLSLYSPASLEVRARIPAPFQGELQQALEAGTHLIGQAHDWSGQGLDPAEDRRRSLQLRLDRLAGNAHPNGVDALFQIEQGGEVLRPGQVLRFTLQRPARSGTVTVPYQAVYGGQHLYSLRNGRLHLHRVNILGGFSTDGAEEQLLVRAEGLEVGDLLVITHLPNAIDGLRAEIATPQGVAISASSRNVPQS